MRQNDPSFGAILEPRLEQVLLARSFALLLPGMFGVQYPSSGRDVGVLAFRTPGKTTARYDSDKRLTIAPSITYMCCNTHSRHNDALCRSTLAPEKCDLPSILLDTAQSRMNTVAKCVD